MTYKKKPRRIKRKKPFFKRKFFYFFIFILFLSGVAFYFLFFFPYFQIKNIEISGNQKINADNLKATVKNSIEKKIGILTTKNIFLINNKKLSNKILNNEFLISNIIIKKKLPETLFIEIKEREPVGTFCQEEKCFYFDNTGMFFEEGKDIIKPLVKDENYYSDLGLGKNILKTEEVSKILEINNKIKNNFQIEIKNFIISSDKEKLIVETEEGWKIFFDLNQDISEKIYNLELVLKEKIPVEQRKNLDYIDLRFKRVYYRFLSN